MAILLAVVQFVTSLSLIDLWEVQEEEKSNKKINKGTVRVVLEEIKSGYQIFLFLQECCKKNLINYIIENLVHRPSVSLMIQLSSINDKREHCSTKTYSIQGPPSY